MELDGSHAAFRGSKLAVASSEGVVTYAVANDVWREEGRVGADAAALAEFDRVTRASRGADSTFDPAAFRKQMERDGRWRRTAPE